jgi:hypothetical protein
MLLLLLASILLLQLLLSLLPLIIGLDPSKTRSSSLAISNLLLGKRS